jgi:hypothetical protein
MVTDPITGQQKKKKKLGGAYPGQRPPQHDQYTPSNFEGGKATAHFVQYGGGNALVLVDGPTSSAAQPQQGSARPVFISGKFFSLLVRNRCLQLPSVAAVHDLVMFRRTCTSNHHASFLVLCSHTPSRSLSW